MLGRRMSYLESIVEVTVATAPKTRAPVEKSMKNFVPGPWKKDRKEM